MILKTLMILIFTNGFSFNTPIQDIRSKNGVYVNDTFVTKTKYYNIKLIQSQDTSAEIYTPIYKKRKVVINDSFSIDLDSVCSKSNLFNDAFSLSGNSIKVIRKNKKNLEICVSLWQAGCSGSFCSDMVRVNIVLNNRTIKTKVTDVSK